MSRGWVCGSRAPRVLCAPLAIGQAPLRGTLEDVKQHSREYQDFVGAVWEIKMDQAYVRSPS